MERPIDIITSVGNRVGIEKIDPVQPSLDQHSDDTCRRELLSPTIANLCEEARDQHLSLYKAALKGDWGAAEVFVDSNPSLVRAGITQRRETALHIAAVARRVHFVEELVKRMDSEDLELQNINNNTALCFAAAAGVVRIAEAMVTRNPELVMIRGNEEMTPLYMAALSGNGDMVRYLYHRTKDHRDLTDADRIGVLNVCISIGLFDVASKILEKHPTLALARDDDGNTALHVLARTPSAFAAGNRLGSWTTFVSFIPFVKARNDKYSNQTSALQLVKDLWQQVLQQDASKIAELIKDPWHLVFEAAELGNATFLIELIRAYPDLIWKVDRHNRTIFHIAVLNRHENIFNLIYEIGSIKDLLACFEDNDNNNILHLAAKLAPPDQFNIISGAALQMQREKLWFKEVEKIVRPPYIERENSEGKTPRALFTEQHKELVKEGEKWMKTTAKSSMVVATLITAIALEAAFSTLDLGGTCNNNNNDDDKAGLPSFLNYKSFAVLAVSEAMALVSSSTSILVFLSILTSRYAEDDFLQSLPFKLVIGLKTLFLSIAALMVAFCATFFVVYNHQLKWIPFPIVMCSCVPVISFVTLLYPLFLDVIRSTYGSRFLFRPRQHMLF